MDIKKIINNTNLELTEKKEIAINEFIFNCYKVIKKVPRIEYSTISEYYIIDVNVVNINGIYSNDDHNIFENFQEELLSDTYFTYKNDLRWNLYLLFVVKKYDILANIPFRDIETDDRFARKLFFDEDDAESFLSKGRIAETVDLSNDNTPLYNPYSEWHEKLEKVNLTGILNTTFSKTVVDNYVFKGTPIIISLSNSKRSEYTTQVQKIVKVSLNKFREECFKEKLSMKPTLINLLSGPNGCGKTSILEAIEFASTGDVRRIKEFNDIETGEVNIECTTDEENVVLQSEKKMDEKKHLDQDWYGAAFNKLGRSSTLNDNFNHFNYLSSEAAYNFAKEESSSDKNYEYYNKITKLIYDEELINSERLWLKYKEEFDILFKKIEKNYEINKNEICNKEQQIQKQNHSNDVLEIVSGINGILNITKSKIVLNSNENYLIQCNKLLSNMATINPIVNSIKLEFERINLNNVNQVKEKSKNYNKKLIDIENKYIQKTKERSIEKEKIDNIILIKNTDTNKLYEASKKLELFEETNLNWNDIKIILLNRQKVNEYKKVKEKILDIENIIKFIKNLEIIYSRVFNLSNKDLIIIDDSEISKIKIDILAIENKINNNKKNTEIAQNNLDKVKQLKITLGNIGKEIIKLAENKNECPLCGSRYEKENELIDNIDTINSVTDDYEILFSKLGLEIDDFKIYLLNENKKLQDNIKNSNNVNLVRKIAEEINNSGYFKIDISDNNQNIFIKIKDVLVRVSEFQNNLKEFNKRKNICEEEGFTDKKILDCDLFCKHNIIYNEFIKNHNTLEFDNFLINEISVLKTSIKNKQANNETASECIDKNNMEQYNQIIINIEKDKNKVLEEISRCNKCISTYNNLIQYFLLADDDDINMWCVEYEKGSSKIQILCNEILEFNDLKVKRDELSALQENGVAINISFLRCSVAIKAIDSLNKLEYYAASFIGKNIKIIDYYFKMLHTPREFKQLNITKDGIVAVRESNNKESRIYKMSTGQRASLALSIMFTLYSTANHAPRFILLDEPVANMDDLHFLNLIDILRDLVIGGSQIFFTTANDQIAGIFRRKFSFFGSEFTHFEFVRKQNSSTEIISIKYRPTEEEEFICDSIE